MNGKARILGGMKRIGVVGILFLAFFGIADSAYLTQSELSGTPLLCNVQSLSGCNVVAASQYSHVFGIPLAEFGILFYSLLFILAALELVIFDQFLRRALQAISFIGLIASLYFTFVQVFMIGALCIYCVASAIIALLIFICATRIEPLKTLSKRSGFSQGSNSPKESLSMPPSV